MKSKFDALKKLLQETAKARQDTRATIAKLNASSKDYSEDYKRDFLNPQIEKAQSGLKALHQKGYEEAARLLQELDDAAKEKHSRLNMDNPAWQNALKIIELSGTQIDGETVKKINANFAGDQSALRALKAIYKNKGVVYDGGIDAQLYDAESTFKKLQEFNYTAMIQEGNLNSFSSILSKIAAKEGIDFPQTIDEAGVNDAIRAAAGLTGGANE